MYGRAAKILFPVMALLACVFAILFIRWSGFYEEFDISVAPVYKSSVQLPPVYVISYADGDDVFQQNQNTLALSAINRGIDHIILYRRQHIDPFFLKKNKNLLGEKRGAGLWLWKPYFILKTLEGMPPNALLLYLDAGYVMSDSIEALVGKLKDKDILLIKDDLDIMAPPRLVFQYATRYAQQQMQCPDRAFYETETIMAASLLLKNTPFTRKFIKEWLDACEDEDLLKGHSVIPDHEGYRGSQEDQSLLGVIAAKYKDRVCFLSFHDPVKVKTLSWHHRRKGATDTEKSILHQTRLVSLRGLDRWIYSYLRNLKEFFAPLKTLVS